MRLFKELLKEQKPRKIFVVPGTVDFDYKGNQDVFSAILGDWGHSKFNTGWNMQDWGLYKGLNHEQEIALANQRKEILLNYPHITGSVYFFVTSFSSIGQECRIDISEKLTKEYKFGCLLQSHLPESPFPRSDGSPIEILKKGYHILSDIFNDKAYLVTLRDTFIPPEEFSEKLGVPMDKIYHI